ncbi:MAG: glycosyltransferase family 4 protein [bacterium]
MNQPIRVALDARRAVRRMTGIGHYVLQLAHYLPKLGPEFIFDLIVDRPIPGNFLPDGCHQQVLGSYIGDGTAAAKFYSPFWLNICVPRYLTRTKVALFHGTNFVVPVKPKCKTVVTIHDLSFLRIPYAYGPIYRRYMKMQVQLALRQAGMVITGSESAKKDLNEIFKVKPEQIVVIYHGVGEEFLQPHHEQYLQKVRMTLGLPNRYILHVGVVEKKKNLIPLIKAGVNVIKQGAADAVVFAGRDGVGADEIRRFASGFGLSEGVKFLGYVPQELLPGLYALARVVVFPSLYEGFGMPVLESMASGVPVVVSGLSSLPEVAGDAAVILKEANAEDIEAVLRLVLEDESLWRDLRERGLLRVRMFSWVESARRHIEVYRRVLEIG